MGSRGPCTQGLVYLQEPLWGEAGFQSQGVKEDLEVLELRGWSVHLVFGQGHAQVVTERDEALKVVQTVWGGWSAG